MTSQDALIKYFVETSGITSPKAISEMLSVPYETARSWMRRYRIMRSNLTGEISPPVESHRSNPTTTGEISTVNGEISPAASRAHKLPEENIKTPIVPKQLDLTPPPAKPKVARKLAGFYDWYELYPKKTGKAAAEKAWEKAVKRAGSAKTIIDGLKLHLPALQAKDRQYVKDPATWLNKGCWEDEVEQPKGVNGLKSQIEGLSEAEAMRFLQNKLRQQQAGRH